MLKFSLKNILIIFLLLIIGLVLKAQSIERSYIVESRMHAGMSLPFYKALAYLSQDDIYAFDISLSFPADGNSYWDKIYHYPRNGIGFSGWSLGNKEVFGNAYVLYHFINFPIKKTEKFSFNYQLSYGAAYITRIFDKYDNPVNRAIGSHTNIYLRVGIDARINIFPRSELVIEAGAFHLSNGKTRSPNYGINAGSLSLGINHSFRNNLIKPDPEIPVMGKRNVQSIVISGGSKAYDNLLDNRYLTSSLTYNFERLLSHRRKIGLGADLFYDASIGEGLAVEEGITENDFSNLVRFGLHASYFIRYKQLMMGVQLGHYLYSRFTVLTPLYSRISVQYLFTKNIFGSVAIKSHFGKADCMEWGIGYCW